MADVRNAEIVEPDKGSETLPALFGKALDDLATLFDAKLTLLKVELKEEVAAYIQGGVMIIAGGIVAAVGFALLNVAIAFLISSLFNNTTLSQPVRYAIGFAITAVIYLVAGAALIIVNKNKIAEQELVPPKTVAELKKDKEFLEDEI